MFCVNMNALGFFRVLKMFSGNNTNFLYCTVCTMGMTNLPWRPINYIIQFCLQVWSESPMTMTKL